MKTISAAIFWFVMAGSVNGWCEGVRLQWTPGKEPDLVGYRLFRSNASGNYAGITPVEIPKDQQRRDVDGRVWVYHDETGLIGNETYYWVVLAYDTQNLQSGFSNEAVYTVPGQSPGEPVDSGPAIDPDDRSVQGAESPSVLPASGSAEYDGPIVQSVGRASGGIVTSPDGGVTMIIPAEAVDNEETISITGAGEMFPVSANVGNGTALFAVNIGPEGLQFNLPVTMVFSWADENPEDGIVDGTDIQERSLIVTRNQTAVTERCYQYPPDECSQQNNSFTLTATELGEWAVVGLDETTSKPAFVAGYPYISGGHGAMGARFFKGDLVTFNIPYEIIGGPGYAEYEVAAAAVIDYPGVCSDKEKKARGVDEKVGQGRHKLVFQKAVPACFRFYGQDSAWIDVDWKIRLKTGDGTAVIEKFLWSEEGIFAVEKP
jgi:hypothetical protein